MANESVRAELGSASDAVDRYRSRVASLAESVGAGHEALLAAMWEAERALITAHRLLVRAEKLAR